jgi:hypothetical protein
LLHREARRAFWRPECEGHGTVFEAQRGIVFSHARGRHRSSQVVGFGCFELDGDIGQCEILSEHVAAKIGEHERYLTNLAWLEGATRAHQLKLQPFVDAVTDDVKKTFLTPLAGSV